MNKLLKTSILSMMIMPFSVFATLPSELANSSTYCPSGTYLYGWRTYSLSSALPDKTQWNQYTGTDPLIVNTPNDIKPMIDSAYPNNYSLGGSLSCGNVEIDTSTSSPSHYIATARLRTKSSAPGATCTVNSSYSLSFDSMCADVVDTDANDNRTNFCPTNQHIVGWQYEGNSGLSGFVSGWSSYTALSPSSAFTPKQIKDALLAYYPYDTAINTSSSPDLSCETALSSQSGNNYSQVTYGISKRGTNGSICSNPSTNTSLNSLTLKPTCLYDKQPQTLGSDLPTCSGGNVAAGWKYSSASSLGTSENTFWQQYTTSNPLTFEGGTPISKVLEQLESRFPDKSAFNNTSTTSCGAGNITKSATLYKNSLAYRPNNQNYCTAPSTSSYYLQVEPACVVEQFFIEMIDPENPTSCSTDSTKTPQKLFCEGNPTGDGKTAGNPIVVGTGEKKEEVVDYSGKNLSFVRSYSSNRVNSEGFSPGWHHNYEMSLKPIYSNPRYLYNMNKGTQSSLYSSKQNACLNGWAQLKTKSPGYMQASAAYQSTTNTCEISIGGNVVKTLNVFSNNINLTSSLIGLKAIREDGGAIILNGTTNTFVGNADEKIKVTKINDTYELKNRNTIETYDLAGKLLSIKGLGDFNLSLQYNGSKLSSIVDQNGKTLTFTYNSDNNISVMTDPNNKSFTYGYDSLKRLETVTNPLSQTTQYQYQKSGQDYALTGILDANNNQFAHFDYDSSGRAILTEHAGGVEKVELTFNTNSVSSSDALLKNKTYTFNSSLNRKKIVSETESCTGCTSRTSYFTYDTNGYINQLTDFNGNITAYSFDASGLLLSKTEGYGTALARTTTKTWDSTFDLPLTISEPGRTTSFTYNTYGSLLSQTVADTNLSISRTLTFAYDTNQRLTSIDGARTDINDVTSFIYNSNGDLTSVTNPLNQVTSFSNFNAHGKPQTITLPNGLVITLVYDDLQRVTSKSMSGLTTTYAYNNIGLVSQVTFSDGSYLSYTYDNAHRQILITDNEGNKIETVYDVMSNVLEKKIKDSSNTLKQKMEYEFNAYGELIEVLGGNGQSTSIEYDGNGNPVEFIANTNRTTTLIYDALDRMKKVTNPESAESNIIFNALDQSTSVGDLNGNNTTYTYNAFGDILSMTSPDTGTSSFVYDNAGNLIQKTDSKSQVTDYVYDALNRLTSKTNDDNITTTYGYDAGTYGTGYLTSISKTGSSMSYVYDVLGRIISQTDVIGSISKTTSYAYNSSGQLSSQTLPSGNVVGFTYSNNDLTDIEYNSSPVLSNITYQAFWGVLNGDFFNSQSLTKTYDLSGREVSNQIGSIDYDVNNNIVEISQSGLNILSSTKNYGYSLSDRLVNFSDSTSSIDYGYDLNGNRTNQITTIGSTVNTTNYGYSNTSNRILGTTFNSTPTLTFTTDNNGSITAYGGKNFTFDADNRLVVFSQTNGNLLTTANYLYNGFNQRIRKEVSVLDQSNNISTDNNTLFIYDKQSRLIAELDGLGSVIQEYIWLGNIPVAVIKNGNLYAIHTDHLNTPRQIDDINGNAVWSWDAFTFGSSQADEDPSSLGVFSFNLRHPGQYYDEESGLFQNHHRDYDPSLGRYIESDPIGLAGGLNTYGYVDGNSLKYVDPEGLDKVILFNNPKDKQLKDSAFLDPDNPNVLSIYSHGDTKNIYPDGFKKKGMNAQELLNYLKSINININDYEQINIMACETGKALKGRSLNLAQSFAKLSGQTVAAPNNILYANTFFVFSNYTINNSDLLKNPNDSFLPRIKRVFGPAAVINNSPANQPYGYNIFHGTYN